MLKQKEGVQQECTDVVTVVIIVKLTISSVAEGVKVDISNVAIAAIKTIIPVTTKNAPAMEGKIAFLDSHLAMAGVNLEDMHAEEDVFPILIGGPMDIEIVQDDASTKRLLVVGLV